MENNTNTPKTVNPSWVEYLHHLIEEIQRQIDSMPKISEADGGLKAPESLHQAQQTILSYYTIVSTMKIYMSEVRKMVNAINQKQQEWEIVQTT